MASVSVYAKEGIELKSHKPKDMIFAKRLDLLMQQRNLYPADVAKLTGINRRRIYEYLSGTYQPTAYAIRIISTKLKVSSDWLLGIVD